MHLFETWKLTRPGVRQYGLAFVDVRIDKRNDVTRQNAIQSIVDLVRFVQRLKCHRETVDKIQVPQGRTRQQNSTNHPIATFVPMINGLIKNGQIRWQLTLLGTIVAKCDNCPHL